MGAPGATLAASGPSPAGREVPAVSLGRVGDAPRPLWPHATPPRPLATELDTEIDENESLNGFQCFLFDFD